ncbi:hypothetical protein, partial [Streptomyces roseoverticillatus]|uniref:hypothetical protein n=1 Tax=Streptomyces roseoverticillatus TaxID=66429 RepID=UPI0004BF07CA
MSHLDEPQHLLVRADGADRSLLYTSDAGPHADLGDFTSVVPIDEPDLGLPKMLAHGLAVWTAARPPEGFASRTELRKHAKKGLQLAQTLAKHLGPTWVVRYWDEQHGTAKFVCWGCQRLHWNLDAHSSASHSVHITVEGEYKWYPLRAEGFGDFAPDDPAAGLGLSDDLVTDLYQWSKDIDASMDLYLKERDMDKDDARRRKLDKRGQELAERTARELGQGRTVTCGGLA